MNEYTPPTYLVRHAWQEYAFKDDGSHQDEFDRWLESIRAIRVTDEMVLAARKRIDEDLAAGTWLNIRAALEAALEVGHE